MTYKKCPGCGVDFKPKHGNSVYCRPACRKSENKVYAIYSCKVRGQIAVCPVCNSEFNRNGSQHVYCSKSCRPSSSINYYKPVEAEPKPRGKYVYGWFLEGETLPFYVGLGSGRRAWEIHTLDGGRLATCQSLRTSSTRIVVFRDNLTDEGALLLESVLIDVFRRLGAVLTNQSSGMGRKEKPPLTLEPLLNI